MTLIDWEGFGEDFGGLDESLLELGYSVEDAVLERVPEEVLSLHSDALGESLQIVDEVDSVTGFLEFSDAGVEHVLFPGLEAHGSFIHLIPLNLAAFLW